MTLAALGLTSRNGKPLNAQSLHNLLRNPIYIGRIRTAGWAVDRKGDFEPLVSEPVFLRSTGSFVRADGGRAEQGSG